MMAPRTFTDEDLTAYLDGEADEALSNAIEEACGHDAELLARIEGLSFPKDLLKEAFDLQLEQAPPMPDLIVPANETTPPSRWPMFGAGAVSGLAAGLAVAMVMNFGQLQPEPQAAQQPGWKQLVAYYQMLYVPETLQAPRGPSGPGGPGGPGGPAGGYGWTLASLSSEIGVNLQPLQRLDGLTFHRAQFLSLNGNPLIQIVYTNGAGTPIAICLVRSEAAESGLNSATLEGMAATDWTTGTHGILVIGGEDSGEIEAVAEQVATLI